ncbi:MAG TPA: universal stress protein [Mycobacteriales bacterium]|nr:universal stress protein [Mycobacteriales bacterium]
MGYPAQPVVVGVDGSERSVEALRWGATEAARLGGLVIAVLACGAVRLTAPYAPVGARWPAEATSPAEDRLAELVEAAFHGSPPVPVRQVCDPRPPVPALLGYGDGAALLVLATSPGPPVLTAVGVRSGTGQAFGSTVLALVRHAPCPIVLLPVDRHPDVSGRSGRTALASA